MPQGEIREYWWEMRGRYEVQQYNTMAHAPDALTSVVSINNSFVTINLEPSGFYLTWTKKITKKAHET